MDVCLINNHFSFMWFIATLQLGLLDCHSSTRKCWNILKTLPTIQALVWHLTKWNASENQNFTVTNFSSIPLCISYSAGNDDKGNANITNGLSCTWQAPNRTTAARSSLLYEVLETDRHGWKLVCTVYKSGFKHANCFFIPRKVSRYSGLSSIKYQLGNARYEATTVGREMWIT